MISMFLVFDFAQQIQELQQEMNKTHKHAIIAESSLKRMSNAYSNLKTQVSTESLNANASIKILILI